MRLDDKHSADQAMIPVCHGWCVLWTWSKMHQPDSVFANPGPCGPMEVRQSDLDGLAHIVLFFVAGNYHCAVFPCGLDKWLCLSCLAREASAWNALSNT